MAIEILGYPNRPIKDNVDSTATLGSTATKAPGGTGVGASSDQVSLTASASLLPVVDTGRVESVQRALATGTFQVDPVRTADKLMQLELIMNGRD